MTSTHLNRPIAIIGAGNMGTSLLRGILNANLTPSKKITISGTRSERLAALGDEYNVQHTTDNAEAAAAAEIVILCVKAYMLGQVLDEMHASLNEHQLIISIAAGVTIESIQKRTGKKTQVVRAMPNIASTIGAGVTAVAFGK